MSSQPTQSSMSNQSGNPLLSERPDIDPTSQTKKQNEAPTDSDSTPQITPVQSQKPHNKKPTKKPKKTTGATSVANSEANPGTTIDLAQDSDEENAKSKFKRQRKNLEEDDIKPADKPPSTYSCLWCKKEVRVSLSSLSNLRVHRDSSCQTGRVSNGFPNRAKAIATGAKLPQTALDEEKNKKGTQEITSHFARVEKFENIILNQIVALWLLPQAIPWN
ncbi:hypothetical protein PGT21_012699 [Puccinia graminis f. sp. tritici]|uniref:Uncharacterized protein n=1 Tax=Puccinia graminis f. sp. tritici TaxID=56615 RepID=A0A5B0QW28_PUCGR|nr:hypothetical protein PGT21_012699 [Puccinia graminis f. sp. tritici]